MVKGSGQGSKLVELRLGPLPVDLINAALGLELEPGEVIFSVPAQMHARRNHFDDFPKCLPHTGAVVSAPSFVGDDFKNSRSIELISRISVLKTGLLVAICIEIESNGVYNVCSLYPIAETKIAGRLEKRFLRRIIPN